ncbi:hypothetical protein SAE02_18740 [Skermanella aerolata]|uniref:Uncharacterized protein n=1 Tax=Skermanella aerolata TaxID=393310 RepID=A0A512DMM9_9PROT|nr:hypothetical protein SAE02_18740 [Skermanella aerolata]
MRAMASRTTSIVSGVTSSGRLSTRETVIGDTPASFATSLKVTLPDERLEGVERDTGKACFKRMSRSSR